MSREQTVYCMSVLMGREDVRDRGLPNFGLRTSNTVQILNTYTYPSFSGQMMMNVSSDL